MTLTVDLDGNAAIINGKRVALTGTQAEILYLLAEVPGRTVRHDALAARLYGARPECDRPEFERSNIRVLVWQLRKRLAWTGVRIEAVRGKGWRLAAE